MNITKLLPPIMPTLTDKNLKNTPNSISAEAPSQTPLGSLQRSRPSLYLGYETRSGLHVEQRGTNSWGGGRSGETAKKCEGRKYEKR